MEMNSSWYFNSELITVRQGCLRCQKRSWEEDATLKTLLISSVPRATKPHLDEQRLPYFSHVGISNWHNWNWECHLLKLKVQVEALFTFLNVRSVSRFGRTYVETILSIWTSQIISSYDVSHSLPFEVMWKLQQWYSELDENSDVS